MTEAFSAAANIGIAAVIGIVLVKAFLGYNKELAKRNETLYTQFTADAAKREAALINTIEGFSLTMEKISKTMDGRLIFPLPKGLSF